MAKLPLRVFGIFLLFVTITVPGCQALFYATPLPELPQTIHELMD